MPSIVPTESRLFHNPRCSKSREALALLQARGIRVKEVSYLDQPPSVAELQHLLGLLGMRARDLMRIAEPIYAALGLANTTLDDDALIRAMHQHPQLIERPVFIHGNRAVIGRPPERVLELLD